MFAATATSQANAANDAHLRSTSDEASGALTTRYSKVWADYGNGWSRSTASFCGAKLPPSQRPSPRPDVRSSALASKKLRLIGPERK